uniref:Uncharacterized protein n=1 Tax=Trachysalambria curvirostris majanivirus TaxID=2984281 RepID=A0A9C7C934_9VIRU|nr:MAG: hypothetical protein [Trachysalambria curvirostris majanivirus]
MTNFLPSAENIIASLRQYLSKSLDEKDRQLTEKNINNAKYWINNTYNNRYYRQQLKKLNNNLWLLKKKYSSNNTQIDDFNHREINCKVDKDKRYEYNKKNRFHKNRKTQQFLDLDENTNNNKGKQKTFMKNENYINSHFYKGLKYYTNINDNNTNIKRQLIIKRNDNNHRYPHKNVYPYKKLYSNNNYINYNGKQWNAKTRDDNYLQDKMSYFFYYNNNRSSNRGNQWISKEIYNNEIPYKTIHNNKKYKGKEWSFRRDYVYPQKKNKQSQYFDNDNIKKKNKGVYFYKNLKYDHKSGNSNNNKSDKGQELNGNKNDTLNKTINKHKKHIGVDDDDSNNISQKKTYYKKHIYNKRKINTNSLILDELNCDKKNENITISRQKQKKVNKFTDNAINNKSDILVTNYDICIKDSNLPHNAINEIKNDKNYNFINIIQNTHISIDEDKICELVILMQKLYII